MTAPQAPVGLEWLLAPWAADLVVEHQAGGLGAVSGLGLDAGSLAPGELFIACRGSRAHGLAYADQALAAGAAAIVHDGTVRPGESTLPVAPSVPVLRLPDLRKAVSALAGRFYGEPARELTVIAVTGTDGKTSVTHCVAHLLEALGSRAGVVGTLGSGPVAELRPFGLTTPDPVSLQRELRRCADQGLARIALEASSHALDQHRLDGVQVDTAVLTGLSRDHLDYHGNVAAYGAAKARLFTELSPRHSLLGVDDAFGRELLTRCPGAWTYSGAGDPTANAALVDYQPTGVGGRFQARLTVGGTVTHEVSWPGRFQAVNLLAAVTVAAGLGYDEVAAWDAAVRLPPVPGRMEPFEGPAGTPRVVVDYAHTPGALAQALAALKPHCSGRLWVVFGCGGDRDRGKRPEMGRIAAEGADRVVLTNDNPRSEVPDAILDAIEHGMPAGRPATLRIPDRAAAIAAAVDGADAADWILVAGKGHETTQEIHGERHPFSDRACVARLLSASREAEWSP